MRLAAIGAAILIGAWLSAASDAWAQGSAAAEVLFDQGREALLRGDYGTACSRFRESDRLDPAVGTKLNLAACEDKRGKIATAWELFRAAAAQLGADDERLAIARQRVIELEPRLPWLTVRRGATAPESTSVRIGDVELASASFGVALPMDPGKYELVVSAPGHATRKLPVELREGEKRQIEVSPGAAAASPPGESGASGMVDPTSELATQDSGGGVPRKTWGYVFGGIGVAGVLVGATTTAILLGKKSTASDHCNESLRVCDQEGVDANESGRALAPISTIAWVVGFAGLGGGAYFLLTSDDTQHETALSAHVAPEGAGVTILRQW